MIELYLENKVGAFMKKRSILLLTIMLGVFLFIGNVKAEEDRTCNAVSLNELRTAAANIKVSYVPGSKTVNEGTDPNSGFSQDVEYKHLDVKLYNLTDKLYVRVETSGNKVNGDEMIVSARNIGPDGAVTIRQQAQTETITYTFKVYSDSYGCSTKTLRTIRLTLPRFNFYSQLDICQDIPDYYLCQEYTTYKVDGSTFYTKVDDYKAKLLAQEENKNGVDLDDNTGIISKAVSTVSRNKYIVAGIVVIAGVIATIYIIKRKKSDL